MKNGGSYYTADEKMEVQEMLDSYKKLRDSDYLNETVAGIDQDVEDCRDINERIFAGFIKDTMIKEFNPNEETVAVDIILDTDSTIQGEDPLRISFDPNATYEDPRLRTSKWYENKIKETVPLNSSAD
jgi:hypothetical protein